MRALVTKDELRAANPGYSKPKQGDYNRMATGFVIKLMNMFFDKIIDKVMASDRVILPKTRTDYNIHELYITSVKNSSIKFLNSHTNGKVFNVVITGFDGPVTIKLSAKRRHELKTRLKNGQSFY